VSEQSSPPPVAVFGLGIIGSRAAEHIRTAGFPVIAWNRTPKEHPDFEADAATVASRAGVLAFYLKDVPAVRSVFDTVAPALGPGKTLVNHATVDLDTTSWLEERCRDSGCAFLNAPFTGSKMAAAGGKLVYYAGCDDDTLAPLRTLLEATSSRILAVGSAANATVIKLTTNLISASTVQALSEALRINLASGVSPGTFLEAVQANACGSLLATMKIPTMAAGDYDPHFSLANMLKDARYALDLASRHGLDTPGIAATAERMQSLADAGLGDLDFSVLFRQFEPHDS
jgi:3-hydroxyisobutyrate dehydrogenase-like beta-hydroxyacid dehydrogenase